MTPWSNGVLMAGSSVSSKSVELTLFSSRCPSDVVFLLQ